MILDYAHEPSTITNALKEGGGQKSESEEDVIMKNGQRDTMLWALKIGEGGCEPWNVNRKTSKS